MSSFDMLIILLLVNSTFSWPFQRRKDNSAIENVIDSDGALSTRPRYVEESLYGLPDNKTGAKVAEWREDMRVNPEELGSYVEGDILFPLGASRSGLKASSARWPNGVVPYMISPYFNAEQRKLIHEAMNDYHKYTCIRFKPYRGEESDYIRITAENSGCWSSVGRIGGWQNVNLQVPNCLVKKGTVIHELMHAIGFLHEQSRYDRDSFVSIQWNNILKGYEGNFKKATKETIETFGVSYDYGSVMHYSAYAFTKNGQPTMLPRKLVGLFGIRDEYFRHNQKLKLGQREGFSNKDIQKIRRMYKCNRVF